MPRIQEQTSTSSYLVPLHTVFLASSWDGSGNLLPPLRCADRVGLQGLFQKFLLLCGPGGSVTITTRGWGTRHSGSMWLIVTQNIWQIVWSNISPFTMTTHHYRNNFSVRIQTVGQHLEVLRLPWLVCFHALTDTKQLYRYTHRQISLRARRCLWRALLKCAPSWTSQRLFCWSHLSVADLLRWQ